MRLVLDALEGQYIPMGYGIAYRDFSRDVNIAYPLGLHFLVRWARDVHFWLMSVERPGYRERIELAAYQRGVAMMKQFHENHEAFAYKKGVADERRRALMEFDAYMEQRKHERETLREKEQEQ